MKIHSEVSALYTTISYIHAGPYILLNLLVTVVVSGISILIGWGLTNIMKRKNFKINLLCNLFLSAIIPLAMMLRYGITLIMVQGIILTFILLYASCSDLTNHMMDDFLWVMVILLGLCSIETVGLPSMITGMVVVFIPQIITAMFTKNSIGGADIKLSTALEFMLGWQKGLAVLIFGLLFAVIIMSIVQKLKKAKKKQPFALIPFLSVASLVIFLI